MVYKNLCFRKVSKLTEAAKFLNYETLDNIDNAFSDFSDPFIKVIDKVAPLKEIMIKNSSQNWFDGEISNAITTRHKKFKTFKKSKSVLHKEIYRF